MAQIEVIQKQKQIPTHYLRLVFFAVLVAFTVFLAVFALPRALITLTQASNPGRVDVKNSYFIGNSLLANADGSDVVTGTVFIRDGQGLAIPNKSVTITGLDSIKLSGLSDENGKVSFKATSTVAGQYSLTATVDGISLLQELRVTFR